MTAFRRQTLTERKEKIISPIFVLLLSLSFSCMLVYGCVFWADIDGTKGDYQPFIRVVAVFVVLLFVSLWLRLLGRH